MKTTVLARNQQTYLQKRNIDLRDGHEGHINQSLLSSVLAQHHHDNSVGVCKVTHRVLPNIQTVGLRNIRAYVHECVNE